MLDTSPDICLHYQTTFTIICLVYKTVVHTINKTQLAKAQIIIYITLIFNLRRCSLHKTIVIAAISQGGGGNNFFLPKLTRNPFFCRKGEKHFGPLKLVFFLPQLIRNKSFPVKTLGQGPPPPCSYAYAKSCRVANNYLQSLLFCYFASMNINLIFAVYNLS